MKPSNRRAFLKQSGLGLAGATLAVAGSSSKALGANERINLGVVGLSRGRSLCDAFAAQDDVRLAYVCDTDRNRLEQVQKRYKVDKAVGDLRKILDDKSVDAVAIATPDHWHAPAAILACEAGKHVYVEKPCSHNIREGRLMIEAARRSGRVMQVGTQTRSSPGVEEAIQMLREGAIGDVLAVKVINSQKRANIGHAEPSDPPEHLDYNSHGPGRSEYGAPSADALVGLGPAPRFVVACSGTPRNLPITSGNVQGRTGDACQPYRNCEPKHQPLHRQAPQRCPCRTRNRHVYSRLKPIRCPASAACCSPCPNPAGWRWTS